MWTELRPENVLNHKHVWFAASDTNYNMQSLMPIYILQALTDSVGLWEPASTDQLVVMTNRVTSFLFYDYEPAQETVLSLNETKVLVT